MNHILNTTPNKIVETYGWSLAYAADGGGASPIFKNKAALIRHFYSTYYLPSKSKANTPYRRKQLLDVMEGMVVRRVMWRYAPRTGPECISTLMKEGDEL